MARQNKLDRKLNSIYYMKAKTSPAFDVSTENSTDPKFITVSYFYLSQLLY